MGVAARLHVQKNFDYRLLAEKVVRLIKERVMGTAAVPVGG